LTCQIPATPPTGVPARPSHIEALRSTLQRMQRMEYGGWREQRVKVLEMQINALAD
jgi:hypothetical protein